jgi:hypothetical protein
LVAFYAPTSRDYGSLITVPLYADINPFQCLSLNSDLLNFLNLYAIVVTAVVVRTQLRSALLRGGAKRWEERVGEGTLGCVWRGKP